MFDCCLDKLKYKLCEIKDKCCGCCEEEQLFDLLIIEHEFDDFVVPDPTDDINIDMNEKNDNRNGVRPDPFFNPYNNVQAPVPAIKKTIKTTITKNQLNELRRLKFKRLGCSNNSCSIDYVKEIEKIIPLNEKKWITNPDIIKISVSGTSSKEELNTMKIEMKMESELMEIEARLKIKVFSYFSSVKSNVPLAKQIDKKLIADDITNASADNNNLEISILTEDEKMNDRKEVKKVKHIYFSAAVKRKEDLIY